MIRRLLVAFALCMSVLMGPALALGPGEALDDPVLEARARALSAELRCMVCQNQSIDDSDADLARDLRILVRERIVAGDSNAQIRNYLAARYGEFVLLKPRFAWHTLGLWIAGPLTLFLGALAVAIAVSRRAAARKVGTAGAEPGLSEDESRRLADLLDPRE